MHKMRKQLMTKKRQDGSTSMVMFFGFLSTNHYLLLPLVLALSCSLCKDLTVFFMYVLISVYCTALLKIFFCPFNHVQYNIHFHACTGWCILSIQPRGFIHCSGGHICSYIWNCGIHSNFFLLSA